MAGIGVGIGIGGASVRRLPPPMGTEEDAVFNDDEQPVRNDENAFVYVAEE